MAISKGGVIMRHQGSAAPDIQILIADVPSVH